MLDQITTTVTARCCRFGYQMWFDVQVDMEKGVGYCSQLSTDFTSSAAVSCVFTLSADNNLPTSVNCC